MYKNYQDHNSSAHNILSLQSTVIKKFREQDSVGEEYIPSVG